MDMIDPAVTASYDPVPEAVPAARDLARAALLSWRVPQALVDDVLIVISELVTNAVVHAQAPVALVCGLADGAVEAGVWDLAPAKRLPDVLAAPSGDRLGQRGLAVVDGLASDWGVIYGKRGKRVWFRLDIAQQARVA
jgi:anti-sigma regulatory factor (Ser/Thr protein kinase)